MRRTSAAIRLISAANGRRDEQKSDLKAIFEARTTELEVARLCCRLVYEGGGIRHQDRMPLPPSWQQTPFAKAQQVPILWPLIFETGHEIAFAHTSFKWANLASHNAGVTVVIVGISSHPAGRRRSVFSRQMTGVVSLEKLRTSMHIWLPGRNVVEQASSPLSELASMDFGQHADGRRTSCLTLDEETSEGASDAMLQTRFVRRFFGSEEIIQRN